MRNVYRLLFLATLALLVSVTTVTSDESPQFTSDIRLDPTPGITDYPPASPCGLSLIWQADGDSAGDYFGFSVAGNGDWDGDGDLDILVGALLADRDTFIDAGSVSAYYYNGLNRGGINYGHPGSDHGRSVAFIRDLDDNGTDECLVGTPGHNAAPFDSIGFVAVQKSFNFSYLYSRLGEDTGDKLGYCVASVGDVDNDGYDDLIAGAPEADGALGARIGYALLLSPKLGGGGAVIHRYDGVEPGGLFGRAVSGAGDVDGDHVPDVIIGAPLATGIGIPVVPTGSAFVYRADGSLIWRFDGENSGDYFGNSVASAGDVNNDGTPDILVGAWHADPHGMTDAGSAYVYSGSDGSLIHRLDGEGPNHNFGYSVRGLGDIDADGYDDFIVGAHRADLDGKTDAGAVYVYSGRYANFLWVIVGAMADDIFGVSVAAAGDITLDGRPDFLVGAFGTDPGGRVDAGSAYLFGCACGCPCKYDPQCDGVISDILDVTQTINIAFRGQLATRDPNCTVDRSDVDASGATDVLDVTKVINVAFRGQLIEANYVEPCPVFAF